MDDVSALAAYYLDRMRAGDHEDALFGLIEADPSVLPPLMVAFDVPENREIRPQIVECVWQHRDPRVIPFLARVLEDPDPQVWQQALDGLVCLGGPNATEALEAVRQRVAERARRKGISVDWIDEALDQIRHES